MTTAPSILPPVVTKPKPKKPGAPKRGDLETPLAKIIVPFLKDGETHHVDVPPGDRLDLAGRLKFIANRAGMSVDFGNHRGPIVGAKGWREAARFEGGGIEFRGAPKGPTSTTPGLERLLEDGSIPV